MATQPTQDIEDDGDDATQAPPPKLTKPAPKLARAAQTAPQTTPQEEAPVSPPELLDQIQQATRELVVHTAAYSALMRTVDAIQNPQQYKRGEVQAPLFQWVTRFNNQPIEIATDLAALNPVDVVASLTPMVNLHANVMRLATEKLHEASGKLLEIIAVSQQVAE